MQETIEGGSLLSSIVNLFFKGIDNFIDSESEYKEEMGVLKQVNRIALDDEDGKETPYTLTIKLSPVRGKKGKFYVEASTTAPGLDVSSINEKVIKLDSSNKDSFVKMVDDLLSKNSLARTEKQSTQPSTTDTEVSDDQEEEIANLIQSAAQADGIEYRTAETDDGHIVTIKTDLTQRKSSPSICDLTISAEDPFEQKPIKSIKEKAVMVPAVDGSGATLGFETFCDSIRNEIAKYIEERKLKEKETKPANSSTSVDATFMKTAGEVSLLAINASCNIRAAIDLIDTVGQDEDFIAGLAESAEQSFRITDSGDETLDVIDIENVDVSSTYDVLFKAINDMVAKLTAIKWAIGSTKWCEETTLATTFWTCSSLLDYCAEWVVRHTDHYPCPLNPYGECACFDCYKVDGKLSIDLIKKDIIDNDLQELVLLLDNYYVNLECNEQKRVADALEELKRILTYAQ